VPGREQLATKSGNGLQKTSNSFSIWLLVIYLLFFYFSVVLVVGVEKALEIKAFPGNRVGNGIAIKWATGCHFQNGSSICSVISTNPSGMLPGWLSLSVAAFSRSQPFCLPNPANILGLEKYRHPETH